MKITKTEFSKLISSVAELFHFRITPQSLGLYWEVLGSLDHAALREAIVECVKDPEIGRWMPKPAEILARYRQPPCTQCGDTGVIVRDKGRALPWTMERQYQEELQPEICPECGGRNLLQTPGAPLFLVQKRMAESRGQRISKGGGDVLR